MSELTSIAMLHDSIRLALTKQDGLYFWKGAFVGITEASAIRTVVQIEEFVA
jgi:hypothetical protein